MLFTSNVFLFLFLPVALLGFQLASRFGRVPLFSWLAVISLVFYGYWNPSFLWLLIGSILLNYTASEAIARAPEAGRTALLVLTIAANIGLLVWFKYLFPVLGFFYAEGLLAHAAGSVVLPLGISFFTFTQIGYLVDLRQEITPKQDFLSYVLFVTFFPHLIAGPIIHHSEMMPQFAARRRRGLDAADLAVGVSWFILGMAKKVLLADRLGPLADALYAHPGRFGFTASWAGLLCYAFQLYFDFSGYSDMALGLARIFSISFPVNFNSPYKAQSIIDFWQRWHMTLSRYLGVYLFNPFSLWATRRRISLGKPVGRKAAKTLSAFSECVAFPLLATMFLAGIWHGAGMQFVLFGLVHGVFLTVNHAIRTFVRHDAPLLRLLPAPVKVLVTFGCVLVGQIFFRALSVRDAFHVLGTLCGLHGRGPSFQDSFASTTINKLSQSLLSPSHLAVALAFCFVVVWATPNTQEILNQLENGVRRTPGLLNRLTWRPTLVWGAGLCMLLFASLMIVADGTSFLYFQF